MMEWIPFHQGKDNTINRDDLFDSDYCCRVIRFSYRSGRGHDRDGEIDPATGIRPGHRRADRELHGDRGNSIPQAGRASEVRVVRGSVQVVNPRRCVLSCRHVLCRTYISSRYYFGIIEQWDETASKSRHAHTAVHRHETTRTFG